jgi:hypothetical protein
MNKLGKCTLVNEEERFLCRMAMKNPVVQYQFRLTASSLNLHPRESVRRCGAPQVLRLGKESSRV